MKRGNSFADIVLFRSFLNDLPLLCVSLSVAALATWLTFLLRAPLSELLGREPLLMLIGLIAAGFAAVGGVVAFRRWNVRYLIAGDGVKALRGIISNSQVDAKLEYYQIRGTEIRRTFFERLIGTGDLHVRGSTSTDTEVAFRGIRDPYRYQNIIQDRHRLEHVPNESGRAPS